jgi:hypothetical protein
MSASIERDDITQVVYIDDRIEEAAQLEDAFGQFEKVDLHDSEWPKALEPAIENAGLIITDLKLDHMARSKPFWSIDGKVLNEFIRAKQRKNPNHPLLTIFSGNLDEVPNPEHHAGRPHILAQYLDADWVGDKTKGSEFRGQLLLLCDARRELQAGTCDPSTIAEYWRSVFKLESDLSWSEEALKEIDRFQPPVQHLYGPGRDERIFLQWMTRVVFPYPTFLLDAYEVSIRLRLDPVQTAALLAEESSALRHALTSVRYGGILAGFAGDRWWRPGLNDWLWDLTGGNPYDGGQLRESLTRVGGR